MLTELTRITSGDYEGSYSCIINDQDGMEVLCRFNFDDGVEIVFNDDSISLDNNTLEYLIELIHYTQEQFEEEIQKEREND